jgi:hypothetical protein
LAGSGQKCIKHAFLAGSGQKCMHFWPAAAKNANFHMSGKSVSHDKTSILRAFEHVHHANASHACLHIWQHPLTFTFSMAAV